MLEMATLPAIGLGTLGIKDSSTVASAISLGYRLIDCAPSYRNEGIVGRGIRASHIAREQVWITSKLWCGYYRPQKVRECLQGTLRDLQVDYVDLYLLHWPFALKNAEFGRNVKDWELDLYPMHEVWRSVEEIQREGLARHIGVANWTVAMLNDLLAYARVRPLVNQIELHPYNSQVELIDYCRRQGVICQGYGPLGPLGHRKTSHLPRLQSHPVVASIAQRHPDVSPAQVLLAWGCARNTPLIVKSSSAEHQRANLSSQQVRLSDDDRQALDELNCGYRYYDYALKKGIPSFS